MIARALVALTLMCITATPSAEEQPPVRDAAQIVREGDVSQWLEHYKRERGAEWPKQQGAQPTAPAPAPKQSERTEGRD